MKSNQLMLLTTLLGATFNAVAACTFTTGNHEGVVLIDVPPIILIRQDTPNDTILYESPPKVFSGPNTYFCTNAARWGTKNSLGTETMYIWSFPIGDSGISWRFIKDGSPLAGFGSQGHLANKYQTFSGSSFAIQLIKTGNIKDGTNIPIGDFGYLQADSLPVIFLRSTKEIAFVRPSCKTPDIQVHMGEHDLSTFSKIGSYSNPTSFDIKLNNCPTGIKNVTYSLAPSLTTPASNASMGIIELNKSSTAKGIAVQIMDSNQQPIEFSKTYVFKDYSTSGGNFSIPLNARYLRTLPSAGAGALDPGMSAGTANSEITFIMSYL